MNAISISHRFTADDAASVHDVGECIRSWGMRGVLLGGLFGFAFAAILVAIPLTTDVLTFGTIGTLIVGAVECAVIAGGFSALAAALYGQGVLRSAAESERKFPTGRLAAEACWRDGDVPLSAWPDRWAFPGPSLGLPISMGLPILQNTSNYRDVVNSSLPDIQASLSSIDSWETGSCGP